MYENVINTFFKKCCEIVESIYNLLFRRTPILGKHSKRITCGAWSKDNILALGSEDKTFSLSSEDGDSLRVIQLRDVPSDMCFAEIKTDERVPGENTVFCIIKNIKFVWIKIELSINSVGHSTNSR